MAYILRKIGNADNVAINYYEVDTEHDMQEIDVANAPMGSHCYVINTGSTYALNSSKEWKLVPTSGGETPSGGTDISLGLTAATVGQTVKVKAVDTDGKPTEWEAVDAASGGGEGVCLPVVELSTTLSPGASFTEEENAKLNAIWESGTPMVANCSVDLGNKGRYTDCRVVWSMATGDGDFTASMFIASFGNTMLEIYRIEGLEGWSFNAE